MGVKSPAMITPWTSAVQPTVGWEGVTDGTEGVDTGGLTDDAVGEGGTGSVGSTGTCVTGAVGAGVTFAGRGPGKNFRVMKISMQQSKIF